MYNQLRMMVYALDVETGNPDLAVTPPEDGSLGMVLDWEIRTIYNGHGATQYYKLLIGEQFLWIAKELLKLPK